MTIKLIASDMDGTFLDAKGSYDRDRFEKVLDALDKRQIPFVVATGNSMPRLEKMFGELSQRLRFVAENGAYVLDKQEVLVRQVMTPDMVADFLAFFKGKEVEYAVTLLGDDVIYLLEGTDFPTFEGIEPEQLELFRERMRFLSDWSEIEGQEIYKMNLVVPENISDKVTTDFNHAFKGRLQAVGSGYGAIDVIIEGCHKAWGLEQLLERYGILPEEVMSFGDSDNDLEMLKHTGESYAMANASDRVKAVAKHIAPSHNDAGVLTTIEHFLWG
ncbi:Cof-type HAD-IIB family hydrolase [Streptococcus hillyeri]|uniref:HAD family hydrolase n=1 Tax=Streptococcus hillyeri TaxID=2282420 RepID=A0A3L9DQI9_9STRE|nr:Cof-type HAD-IIB family hydrolase [Streptococcus hillyeri]RLY01929.1 HAD family hydrolase [Streptococcus hillyeri]